MNLLRSRIHDDRGGKFYLRDGIDETFFESHDDLLQRLVDGTSSCFSSGDLTSIVELVSDVEDDMNPLAVIWRTDSIPVVLHLSPIDSPNLFRVAVKAVPPKEGFQTALKIMNTPDDGSIEVIHPEKWGHDHYLLNEITLRAALALCYESTTFDNEVVRILCCVEDKMSYLTDIDAGLLPSHHKPVKYSGVTYDYTVHGEKIVSGELRMFDSQFFFAYGYETDETAHEEAVEEVYSKVEPYLDTRAPTSYGNSNYWVEMIRCAKCGQRVILGLAKAQCPDGQPDVSFACKACKTTIKHL